MSVEVLGVGIVLGELVVVGIGPVAGLAHTRYALDGYLPNAVLETRETRVDGGELLLPLLDEFLEHLALLLQHHAQLDVHNVGIELAAHERGALVLFDVAVVGRLGQVDVRAEALLAEIARGELVRVR